MTTAVERQHKYRDAHREVLRERGRQVRERDRELLRERCRQYDAAHREERSLAAQIRYWDNREEILAKKAVAHLLNAEVLRQRSRAWQLANPEAKRAIDHRRRAKQTNAGGTHTAFDIRNIYNDQDGLCFWCDFEVGEEWHVDHLIPLSKGGSNGPENIVVSCPTCNMSKGSSDPIDFLERVA